MTEVSHATRPRALPVGRVAWALVGIWLAAILISYYRTASSGTLVGAAATAVALVPLYIGVQRVVVRYLSGINRWLGALLALLPAVLVFLFAGLAVRAGVLTFLAVSLLVAAVRGDPGCEVMSIPALLRGKDTRLACIVFSPIDWLEAKMRSRWGSAA